MNKTQQKEKQDNGSYTHQPKKVLPKASDYNGTEEPVEENSDTLASDTNDNEQYPAMNKQSPEPGKTEKKIPNLRNGL